MAQEKNVPQLTWPNIVASGSYLDSKKLVPLGCINLTANHKFMSLLVFKII